MKTEKVVAVIARVAMAATVIANAVIARIALRVHPARKVRNADRATNVIVQPKDAARALIKPLTRSCTQSAHPSRHRRRKNRVSNSSPKPRLKPNQWNPAKKAKVVVVVVVDVVVVVAVTAIARDASHRSDEMMPQPYRVWRVLLPPKS